MRREAWGNRKVIEKLHGKKEAYERWMQGWKQRINSDG